MTIEEMILEARAKGCSDIHLSEGMPVFYRIDGTLAEAGLPLGEKEIRSMILNALSEEQQKRLASGQDVDFAIQTPDGCRQRVNVFRQQKKLAATIRLLNDRIPSLGELKLPNILQELASQPRGLILVTGPTGSGKSTTLAAMVEYINERRADHIVTIEDPIEYVFTRKKALVHQREVGEDTDSFAAALRSVLREDPDVILVGEMRDYETISAAVTAAETGHLVLSTLHTTGAAQTIDRIVDACPAEAKNQVQIQLAGILKGVVTQCLIPSLQGGRIAATEVLTGTDAALNLIRENKCHQMGTVMQSGAAYGMHTLNKDLVRLATEGKISVENAFRYSNNRKELEQMF
ncbi:type IV pilus twitching motility protein PilT [Cuneatibacter sp. NSJ-177]|uniref:type IV pilus twitching motility protein PilT n=1 Tax=Cuneatibacter sp. NSJ-177 TaxID=2931401 RepID=UPI001FD40727|nr:type IV pilus twitching motility protein PilT [Cuneatibacter sp. NSJ-177]MCJ7835754.1 type IV pilus twitching motility protein PilT [Cuneatibacter sp. NSJ-177]